jgi:uncharacterized membrane protein YfcA
MELPMLLAPLLGVLVGLTLGLFGGGGTVLTFPALVYLLGVAPSSAVGSSLAVVAVTSTIGTMAHARRGHVNFRAGALFAAAGAVTSVLGARLTALVPERFLVLAFAGVPLAAGGFMLRERAASCAAARGTRASPRLALALAAGGAAGVLTGFLGVGGGFLVLPALVAFGGLGLRSAIGTSLFVIAINSTAGFLGHLDAGRIDYGLIALLVAGASAGALAGERIGRRIASHHLRRGFAALVVAVGVWSGARAAWASSPSPASRCPASASGVDSGPSVARLQR